MLGSSFLNSMNNSSTASLFLKQLKTRVDEANTTQEFGFVANVMGNVVYSLGPQVQLGAICSIVLNGEKTFLEVIAFQDKYVVLSPLENISGIFPGLKVEAEFFSFSVLLSIGIQGSILDGLGRLIKEKNSDIFSLVDIERVSVFRNSIHPVKRNSIQERFHTGIKAIDSLLTVGKGQRMGIFAGSGVGKTTLLTMLSKYTDADINVIALIGERGREAAEFINENLGEEGREKSIIVISTSDKSAMERVKAAYVATTVAEYFRDKGKNVLLLMDSLTRFAMAQREIGLSVGEPPTSKGYTPSVFSSMSKLLERVANSTNGSITAFYTVLVEGDNLNDPIADAARGILDGHIVLSREMAARGHYPAVDITNSISRLFSKIVSPKHLAVSYKIRELISVYEDNKDIISLGAYKMGTSTIIDEAVEKMDSIRTFLKQNENETFSYEETLKQLLVAIMQ